MNVKRRITLRISILGIYVITFILMISFLMTLESLTFLRVLDYTSTNLLENTSQLIIQELKMKGNTPETLTKLTKKLLENGFIDTNQMMEYSIIVSKLTTTFQIDSQARVSTWIDRRGNSVSTFLESDGTYSSAIMDLNSTPPIHKLYYRNAQGQIIKIVPTELRDLRQTPRYIEAIKAKHFTWTDAFLSQPSQNLTTSAITPIYDKKGLLQGVFSMDIKLQGMAYFLQSLHIGKNGVAFIIDGKNELIAFPGMHKESEGIKHTPIEHLRYIEKPWVVAALDEFKKTKKTQFVFQYNNEDYVAHFPILPQAIPEVANYGWRVGVVVPESDFIGEFERQNILMIITGISIVLIGILIASIFSKLITNRLKMLVDETDNIKNFDFEGKRIESVIREVHLLALAIDSMKTNLRSFKKYLPANLVRQLIESGQDVRLGGDVKTLSILFSDIKNFTRIAESLSPQQLMLDLSTYLDTVSTIIVDQQGTIDKFIGDSIMAFWSAPLHDQNHCEHACRTALVCQEKINHLNELWRQHNKTPFITRFGVHTGEVIVGNVGSAERMNYTAIGDSINITSRLENLNKIYGTSILVSAMVVAMVGDLFVFRKIDETEIKGKTGGHTIYELIAEQGNRLNYDLQAYQKHFEPGFKAYQQERWEDAIVQFQMAQKIHPKDTVAKVFIRRCRQFMKKAPQQWDGIWRNG